MSLLLWVFVPHCILPSYSRRRVKNVIFLLSMCVLCETVFLWQLFWNSLPKGSNILRSLSPCSMHFALMVTARFKYFVSCKSYRNNTWHIFPFAPKKDMRFVLHTLHVMRGSDYFQQVTEWLLQVTAIRHHFRLGCPLNKVGRADILVDNSSFWNHETESEISEMLRSYK